MTKRGLGKGLDAIFGESPSVQEEKDYIEIKITEIEPNREQPRKYFDEEQLKALSLSIEEHGLIQPIIVSNRKNGFYSIIAGERRWRASKMAGLKVIPAVVRDYSEEQTMQVALVENLQREDLNPIEEAEGYFTLAEKFGLTQEKISEKIGKSRSYVANAIRLLSLSDDIKELVIEGSLSGGHARTLLSVEDGEKRKLLAKKTVAEQLSVRELEKLATEGNRKKSIQRNSEFIAEYKEMERKLSSHMAAKVKIINKGKKGKIEIEYYNNEDLCRILDIIGK